MSTKLIAFGFSIVMLIRSISRALLFSIDNTCRYGLSNASAHLYAGEPKRLCASTESSPSDAQMCRVISIP
ncbi:MAG TPA: hypothetical protein VIT23_16500, partial [Terrimicrobiaceae bacterium]